MEQKAQFNAFLHYGMCQWERGMWGHHAINVFKKVDHDAESLASTWKCYHVIALCSFNLLVRHGLSWLDLKL